MPKPRYTMTTLNQSPKSSSCSIGEEGWKVHPVLLYSHELQTLKRKLKIIFHFSVFNNFEQKCLNLHQRLRTHSPVLA